MSRCHAPGLGNILNSSRCDHGGRASPKQHCSALFISTEDNVNVLDALCIAYSARGTTTQDSRKQHVSACQGLAQKGLKDCLTW